MKYYIKKRINPQFSQPYYVALGKISKKRAKKWEETLYGENVMLSFENEEEYNKELKELEKSGLTIYYI